VDKEHYFIFLFAVHYVNKSVNTKNAAWNLTVGHSVVNFVTVFDMYI